MKKKRQQMILEQIENNICLTQEDLQNALKEAGFKVTQSTISRDIKELNLIKGRDANGNYRYLIDSKNENSHTENQYSKMFADGAKTLNYALNNVVIKCYGGMASSVCVAIDAMFGSMMLGSLAGDDTIIIVTRSEEQSKILVDELGKTKNA